MPSSQTSPLDVHVLAHTHWDREWYHSAPRFRQRLAALVQDLPFGDTDDAHTFLLDGQAVVLEDVLAVRPDLRRPLEDALQRGVIEAGPWYVLADELIPSGEALVRNLLAGRQVLRSLGASAPDVCYSPDAFGHAAALPSIAAGFGLRVAVLWRGYGGPRWPAGDTVRWRGPDGASLLVWHLPPDGYEFGRALPTAPDAADSRWQEITAMVATRSRTGVVLLTNGADHHALQPQLDEAVQVLASVAKHGGHTVQHSSLSAWARAFAAASEQVPVPEVEGELRDSYGYTWTLQGTLATRAWQKRAVARADALLRHDVEPWIAMAQLAGSPAASELRESLHHTWRTFLRTLPHDTLCGCSIDAVARALDHRLDVVRSEACGLRDTAIDLLLARDPVAARNTARDSWQPRLVLRNRTARERFGLAEVEIVRTIADVAVGPGSALAGDATADASDVASGVARGVAIEVVSAAANTASVPGMITQSLGRRRAFRRRESPQHYPDNDLVEITRALMWIPPSLSLGGFALRTIPLREQSVPSGGTSPALHVSREHGSVTLRNAHLELQVSKSGVVLHDLARGRVIYNLVQLTWQADHGDTYTSAPRGDVRTLRAERMRVVASGPLRAIVAIRYAITVQTSSARNERGSTRPRAAAARPRTIRVVVRYALDAGASHVRLDILGRDRAHDHRLRVSLATGIASPRIVADAAFGPVVRTSLDDTSVDETHEHVVHAAPLHRWVAADGGDHGSTIVSDGLAEYEALPDARIAVTLLRATGELSRSSLAERPGHAGWPAAVPGAQGPGRIRARLAVAPHGAFDPARANLLADDVLLPLIAHTWRDAPQHAPDLVEGVTLEAEQGVVASAVKPAEQGHGVVLRAVNLHDAPRTAEWIIPNANSSSVVVRLDESPVHTDVESATLLRPREIRSLLVTSGSVSDERAGDDGDHQRDAG